MEKPDNFTAAQFLGFLAGPNSTDLEQVSFRNPKTGRKRRWHPADDFGEDDQHRFETILARHQFAEGTVVHVLRSPRPRLSAAEVWEAFECTRPLSKGIKGPTPEELANDPDVTPRRPNAPGPDSEPDKAAAAPRYEPEADTIKLSHFERLKSLAAQDFELATLRMRQEHERAMAERDHSRQVELDAEQRRHERLLAEMGQRFEVHRAETNERHERETDRARAHAEQMEAAKKSAVEAQLSVMRSELEAARAEMDELNKEADEHAQVAQAALVKAEEKPQDLQGWAMQQIQSNPHLVERLMKVLAEKLTGEAGMPPN